VGLPKALLIAAATLFMASVLGALAALGVFFWYDTDFWDYFADPGPVLAVAAAILSALSVSSGVLFVHFRSQETYTTFEEILFGVILFVALVNLLWRAPVLFFL
jgi:hypothetical protein